MSLKEISDLFALHENLPLSVKISDVPTGSDLQAELAEEQVERFQSWEHSLLSRLLVLGASLSQVEAVLERTRLNRDVIAVEALGMFEHAFV